MSWPRFLAARDPRERAAPEAESTFRMIDQGQTRHPPPIVVLVGPTAVGKSALAVALAQQLHTEVLAADSRQVYRGMDIATDKPTRDEQAGVPHRLIDLAEPEEAFNAGRYRQAAEIEIARLHAAGTLPLVVGGTGLWVRALLGGLCDGPPSDPALRAALAAEAERVGIAAMHRRLAELDPPSAARIHPHDRVKVLRALEVHAQTGQSLSTMHDRHAFAVRPYAALLIGLRRERDDLYTRIEQRIDRMIARGVIDETRGLLARGLSRQLGSMKGLGYKQIAGYLAGEYSEAEAIRLLKRDTRHFAKRQLTWFRKEPGILWLSLDARTEATALRDVVLEHIHRFLRELAAPPPGDADAAG